MSYRSQHEFVADVLLYRDYDRSGPVLVVSSVTAGGRAEAAGLSPGWQLSSSESDDLVITAPLPGITTPSLQVKAQWSSLQNMWLQLKAPAQELKLDFAERPLGFTWTQDFSKSSAEILICDVLAGGRAAQNQVCKGMVLRSITVGEQVVTEPREMRAILQQSDKVPVSLCFVWGQPQKLVAAGLVAGVTLEDRHDDKPEIPETDAANTGVFITCVPTGHPLSLEGVGPGWQVVASQRGSLGGGFLRTVNSLSQLPSRLVQTTVELSFIPPSPLHSLLPLERTHEDEDMPPRDWRSVCRGAALAEVPWQDLENCDVGVLRRCRFRCRVAPGVTAEAGSGSSSSSKLSHLACFEAVVLGQLPVLRRASDLRIRTALASDGAAWELRQALEALGPGFQPGRRVIVMAVRRCSERRRRAKSEDVTESSLMAAVEDHESDGFWLPGLLLGESAAQIIYRWCLFQSSPSPASPARR